THLMTENHLHTVVGRPLSTVLGFGSDQDYQIDIINELDLANATYGITQVAGLHNSSKAFLFRDVGRAVYAPEHLTERVVQMFRSKTEFTFLASIQQKASTSGVIFSIHESEHSYFELESSGVREEIRYHYRFNGKPRSESFPYRLADGQWHKIALTISATHLLLHVDCNRIYERLIDPPQTELTAGSGVWLGQHTHKHGLFKVRLGPRLHPPHTELRAAVSALGNGIGQGGTSSIYRLPLSTPFQNGLMVKVAEPCPELNCTRADQILPDNRCCNVCKGGCLVPSASNSPSKASSRRCPQPIAVREELAGGLFVMAPGSRVKTPVGRFASSRCAPRPCGYDFCTEGLVCGENSECRSRSTRAECECRSGFASSHGDSTYCEDIDECATQMHYCQSNTACVNLPGSHRCDCLPGFIRVDEYSCTERDECAAGQSSCDDNAICTNTIRGHLCTCKPGYVGNGTTCRAFCEDGCRNGGTCVSPNSCVCPSGFTGRHCETDIDECAEGLIECHNHSHCVNLPGWYHCECRDGYHDNGSYLLDGGSCADVDECSLQTHTCWNDSVCVNLPGGYDCVCASGPGCSGDCPHEGGVWRNGEDWKPSYDPCAVCSCKTFCRREPCDCGDPREDLSCCPSCDQRPSSQCLDQSGRLLYRSGASWLYNCHQCHCMEGEVECWPLQCPVLTCEYAAVAEGECCPRCVSDPCQAERLPYDVRRTCRDPAGAARLSGASWRMPSSPCTTCKCKNGNVCCSVDPDCLQNY
uniref:Neural EGFL like 1 n=1 Tax=Gadus morhua TaxID=8049 RepID=A0A8C5BL75_GADMO